MPLTAELLKQLIASLSPSEDTEAVLNFLTQSHLTQSSLPGNDQVAHRPSIGFEFTS